MLPQTIREKAEAKPDYTKLSTPLHDISFQQTLKAPVLQFIL
jgi:hypothetical protein